MVIAQGRRALVMTVVRRLGEGKGGGGAVVGLRIGQGGEPGRIGGQAKEGKTGKTYKKTLSEEEKLWKANPATWSCYFAVLIASKFDDLDLLFSDC